MEHKELELIQAWQKLKENKFNHNFIKQTDIMDAIKKDSSLTVNLLKKRVKAKLNWIILFITLFSAWMIIEYNNYELLLILGFFNVLYIISFVLIWPFYRRMEDKIDLTENTLDTMKNTLTLLNKVLNYEKLFGIFGFPISLIVGALIKMNYRGFSISDTFHNERILFFLLIAMVVIVPLMFILTEWMNKLAFGKLKNQLEQNIAKLEVLNL